MNTKEKIIQIADIYIRQKGCNAFSFSDISKHMGIKNASVHYHFPSKSDLIIAIIQKHLKQLEKFELKVKNHPPLNKIKMFLTVYSVAKSEGKISILGSLTNDYLTFELAIQNELKKLTDYTLSWLTQTLEEGKVKGVFNYTIDDRNKALMIITNILGAEQLSRLTYNQDFQQIKETIINDLIQ